MLGTAFCFLEREGTHILGQRADEYKRARA
jgi:hypothetical protein